jgi:hypothetical protein
VAGVPVVVKVPGGVGGLIVDITSSIPV